MRWIGYRIWLAGLMLVVLSGCGRRLVGMVEAEASVPMPAALTWAAVPGASVRPSDMNADATSMRYRIALENVAAILAGSLNKSGWTWINNPDQAEVWVIVSWKTEGPIFIQSEPVYITPRFGTSFSIGNRGGMRWGRPDFPYGPPMRPYHRWGYRRGFYPGPRLMYAQPRIQAIYRRSLTLQALKVSLIPEAVRSTLLVSPNMTSPPVPVEAIPEDAVLWSVNVVSDGSRDNTLDMLPLLAAAAAESAGRTFFSGVRVDDDLLVTFSDPSE